VARFSSNPPLDARAPWQRATAPQRHFYIPPYTVETALTICALASFAAVVWDVARGGFYFTILGLRISSWETYKPLRNGLFCTVAALYLHDRTAARHEALWQGLSRRAPWIVASVAIAFTVLTVYCGIDAAGGADAYGYVTQAGLWASHTLIVREPFLKLVSQLGPAVAPLGYYVWHEPGTMVPTYAPGLPIAMAIASTIGGAQGVYIVVPLLGGLAVWLTFVLGRRVAGPIPGLVAAMLFAFSPIFVFQSLEPMSDVPATAWWLLAWVLALLDGVWPALGSGLAVSAAVLTRPNLVPLAAVLAIVVARTGPRLLRTTTFTLGVVPSCVAIATLNWFWYGSPLQSGYGTLGSLFAWQNVGENFRHYVGWLVALHSPAILVGLAAPFVTRARHAWSMIAFSALLLVLYLSYFVYESWTFLRFLLPALPLLFILGGAVVVAVVERLPVTLRTATIFLVLTLVPYFFLIKADSLNVFAIQAAEHRYAAVGELVDRALPANAAIITQIESGSIRLYGHRPTVRWDLVERPALAVTLDHLQWNGYKPYVVLEDWEEAPFRARFDGMNGFGRIEWTPAFSYNGLATVRIYPVTDAAPRE